MKKTILFFLVIFHALPAFAAEATEGGFLVPGLKLVGALAVVLAIVLLLYALSRKGLGFLPSAKGGAIQVVEMRSLGPKKGLCLVRVRGEEFLLGLGADRVELLSRVKPAEPGFEGELQACVKGQP